MFVIFVDLVELFKVIVVVVLVECGFDVFVLLQMVMVECLCIFEYGDYVSNLVMQFVKKVGINLCELVGWFVEVLIKVDGIVLVEVVGLGFINMWLEIVVQVKVVISVIDVGYSYGYLLLLVGCKVNLEFVFVNFIGLIYIGGICWVVVGDVLGCLFIIQGVDVVCEYYFNDYGVQID